MSNLANDLYEAALRGVGPKEWRRKANSQSLSRRRIKKGVVIRRENGKIAYGKTRDASPDSLGVHSYGRIPESERVFVKLDDAETWNEAKVVHCTRAISGFNIGLRMVERPEET